MTERASLADREGSDGTRGQLVVLLVDDHAIIRSGLRMLLESTLGHSVIEASSAETALEAARTNTVDIVLLDVRMPGRDGLWTLQELRGLYPALPVVMLSTYDDAESVRASLENGAAGYLVKGAEIRQVEEAIKTALEARGVYVHPEAAKHLLPTQEAGVWEPLTKRELEVLRLLVEGATNAEISKELFVTEKTVKTHLSAIFRKLDVANRTRAVIKAIREGLIDG
jgi:DNA-binding NarL/FixJ family response regulator